MNKKPLFLVSIIMLLTSAILFTSCNKKNDYEKLIVGKWLYLDPVNTDYSYVATYKEGGKLNYQYAIFKNEQEGYLWYSSTDFTYSFDDDMLIISGVNENGKKIEIEVEILSMEENNASFNTLVYTEDGVTVPEEIGKYEVVKIEETSDKLMGCWKMTLEGYEAYYNIQENNRVICYEKIGDGEWTAYQHESFFSYGNYVALTYYETPTPNTPSQFISYTWTIEGNVMLLSRTENSVPSTSTLVKVDESELPDVEPEKIIIM